jgi:trafficking protein particle complex subunit 13
MLSRRIPLVAPSQSTAPRQQPASALPLHLQRSSSVAPHPPSRPGTPPINQPSTPLAYRPASPRTRPMSVPSRPQTPVQQSQHPPDPLEIDLVRQEMPQGHITVDTPVRIKFSVGLSAAVPEGRRRIVKLAVQHVQLSSSSESSRRSTPALTNTTSPRPGHGAVGSVATQNSLRLITTPVPAQSQEQHTSDPSSDDIDPLKHLPRPIPTSGDEEKYARLDGARLFGTSIQFLPSHTLEADGKPVFVECEMAWIPVRRGFVRLGGVRVIVIEDHLSEVDGGDTYTGGSSGPPRILKEWDVVGEVWVA